MMKNKKGFMLGEFTLKVIVAVLCIALLIYLLFAIYSIFTSSSEIGQAKASLDIVVQGIGIASSGSEGEFNTVITEPSSWLILYYSAENVRRPLRCGSNACICMCKEKGMLDLKDQEEICDSESDGTCAITSNNVEIAGQSLKIEEAVDILIKKEGAKIVISKK